MNNPFDYVLDADCKAAMDDLIVRLDALKGSGRPDVVAFCRELEDGKMLGVLIAVDEAGERKTLYAFSGQLGNGGFYFSGTEEAPGATEAPEFVGPAFDYLQPDGYYKTREGDICRQNREIEEFERGEYAAARREYERERMRLNEDVERYREECEASKRERKTRRAAGALSDAEQAAMIRQSQFEKAELKRRRQRMEKELEPLASELRRAEEKLRAMKEKRRGDSEALQQWLFNNFQLLNARGESRSVGDIFADTQMKVPPTGAGECCAPKLLQAAYRRGWKPVSMAECWYGRPKGGEVRKHGEYYPACRGKCGPVLTWMLQGLDVEPPLGRESWVKAVGAEPRVVYENGFFCVVEKPSGMLSVPGKDGSLSAEEWLRGKYGAESGVKVAHRLDQDTSGLLVATFGELWHRVMQRLFSWRQVQKTYVADLEGDYKALGVPERGRISLPLSPDWLDRPRQRVDRESGKEAVTDYEFTGSKDGRSRVVFHPLTGRTHQLRVHSASDEGLGMAIAGDRLYGKNADERLHLHAHRLEFLWPVDGQRYVFESEVPF